MAINKLASEFANAKKRAKTPAAIANLEKMMKEVSGEGAGVTKGAKKGGIVIGKELEVLKKEKIEIQTMAKEMGKTARAAREFLSKVGFVVKNVALQAAQATQAVAKKSAEAVSQYTKAISEDININKKNFISLVLARTSPLLGYFISKVFETDIFRRFFEATKEKAKAALGWMGRGIAGLWKKVRGKKKEEEGFGGEAGGAEEMGEAEIKKFRKPGSPLIVRHHSPAVIENPEALKGLNVDIMHVTANIVNLTGELGELATEKQNVLIEKFTREFSISAAKQEEQFSMFSFSMLGGRAKKGGPNFFTQFRELYRRQIFPLERSWQDHVVAHLTAIRNILIGKEKRPGFLKASWQVSWMLFQKTLFYDIVWRGISGILKTMNWIRKYVVTGPLKVIWAPFRWFFFKKFGKGKYKLPSRKLPATQYTAQLLGLLYSGTMEKLDDIVWYLGKIGTHMGADVGKGPPRKEKWTAYGRFFRPMVSWIGKKLVGPIAQTSVKDLIKAPWFKKLEEKRTEKRFKKWEAARLEGREVGAMPTARKTAGEMMARKWREGRGILPGMVKAGRSITTGLGKFGKWLLLEAPKPKTAQEAIALATTKTTFYLHQMNEFFKKQEKREKLKALKEKLKAIREKGKALWDKIKKFALMGFGMIKLFITKTIGSIIPKLTGALTAVLTAPAIISALGSGAAVIGAGVVGYQIGKKLNTWMNKAVKKFTGEETLGEWAVESLRKHPGVKRLLTGVATGGVSEIYGWFKKREEKTRVSDVRAKYYAAKMSSNALSLMGDTSRMGIEEMAQKFVTLREEGAITKKGDKWVTLEEAAKEVVKEKPKITEIAKTKIEELKKKAMVYAPEIKAAIKEKTEATKAMIETYAPDIKAAIKEKTETAKGIAKSIIEDVIPALKEKIAAIHVPPELAAKTGVLTEITKGDFLKNLYEKGAVKTGETFEEIQKRMTPIMAQTTRISQNIANNVSSMVQGMGQQQSKNYYDQSMDALINNEIV